jgi:hypothetical protein
MLRHNRPQPKKIKIYHPGTRDLNALLVWDAKKPLIGGNYIYIEKKSKVSWTIHALSQ